MTTDVLPTRLNDKQRAAATSREPHIAVTAGAGTGKTSTLVARYLSLLAIGKEFEKTHGTNKLTPRRIVAVTFTRKAAREMRNRIREEVLRLSSEAKTDWDNVLIELDAARIDTIHTLCADILRTHPAEAGVDPYFMVLDEQQAAQLKRDAVEQALNWAAKDEAAAALFGVLGENDTRKLAELMMKQRDIVHEIAESKDGVDWLVFWQGELERRQAIELTRLVNNSVFDEAVAVLEDNEADDPNDLIQVQRDMALAALQWRSGPFAEAYASLSNLKDISLRGGSAKKWPGGREQMDEVKDALDCLRQLWGDARLLNLQFGEIDTTHARLSPQMLRLFKMADSIYKDAKSEREALDFDDLELLATDLLSNDGVRAHWQEQVGALLVDEYQDTNGRQNGLLKQLVHPEATRFIVGDRKQSIYGFRGADVSVFAAEKSEIERQANGKKDALFDLEESFRPHADLLAIQNALLRPILGEEENPDEPWCTPFEALSPSSRRDDKRGYTGPRLEFHLAQGNKAEALSTAADGLAERIRTLCAPGSPLQLKDVAILCRASSAFAFYEDALDAAGIPYVTVAGKGFYDRPEIRDLLNILRAIEDPHDDVALVGYLRSPAIGLTDESIFHLMRGRTFRKTTLWDVLSEDGGLESAEQQARLEAALALLSDLNREAGRTPVADILKRFLDQTHYPAIVRLAGQTRALANINKLLADVHRSELVSISRFIEQADQLRAGSAGEGEARAEAGNAVQIMTIHKAKGLEFPVVVLGDAGAGRSNQPPPLVHAELGVLMPMNEGEEESVYAAAYQMATVESRRKEDAERLRLLYVALTRAEEIIMISGYGRKGLLQPSKDKRDCKKPEKSWLKMLLEVTEVGQQVAGAAPAAIDQLVSFSGADVRVCVYPTDVGTQTSSCVDQVVDGARPALDFNRRMLAPLSLPSESSSSKSTPNRVWQIIQEDNTVLPSWVIGKLVHEAISARRLSDAGLPDWAEARAKEFGLTSEAQITNAVSRTTELVARLRNSEIYDEIEKADKRLHEVPFSLMQDDHLTNGYIDLFFRRGNVWTVVDFKTDEIKAGRPLPAETKSQYEQQVRGYGQAVEQLLGARPDLRLCYLDFNGAVRVESIAFVQ